MKNKLGISIYPEIVGVEPTKEYIKLAHENGFRRIFMNLLEVDKNDSTKIDVLKEVAGFARRLDFEVIVDVNPQVYDELSLDKTETKFFADLNASGIRLDEDFGGEIEAELSKNPVGLAIELNASAGTTTIDKALKLGGKPSKLIACHNFYPMEFTALGRTRFMELTAHYKAIGVRTAAFITLPKGQKDTTGPWNVNDGMPTLEEHRWISVEDQVLDYLSMGLVDDIVISSQGATKEQFRAIKAAVDKYNNIINSDSIEVCIKFLDSVTDIEKDIILKNKGKLHSNRPDRTEYFVRSTYPRIDYKEETIKTTNTPTTLRYGEVVIVNENLGRYKGELHLIKKEFENKNKARNVVGTVCEDCIYKLKFLIDPMKYKLIECKGECK